MVVNLKKMMTDDPQIEDTTSDDVAELRSQIEQEKESVGSGKESDVQCGDFGIFSKLIKQNPAFNVDGPQFGTQSACLQRLQALFQPLKSFIERVRLSEGLLSRAQTYVLHSGSQVHVRCIQCFLNV